MALLNLRYEGDPLLRKKSREVTAIDDRIKELIADMIETLYEEDGYGLAAPQVGKLKRIAVIDMRNDQSVKVLINPEIIEESEKKIVNIEGCLSVPEQSGYVERPQWVKVAYTNENGESCELVAQDYFAACVCHELDHLDGILYIDKTLHITEEEFEQIKAKE